MATTPSTQNRYVAVFDTDSPRVLNEEVPQLLEQSGLTALHYFPRLGIAIVAEDANIETLQTRCQDQQLPLSVLPETTYHAISSNVSDTAEATWGLHATEALNSPYTGAGIKVAVLDTGFNTEHPDFAGRQVTTASFIAGEGPQDVHGHGTHCAGTAVGPRTRTDGRGYGVAPDAQLFAGKVLGADGSGTDTSILAGIDWALQQGCQVISMSLGADIREVHPPYVAAGKRALEQGSIIIAAAGNNAQRRLGNPGFVGAPANSPYVMAVGAVDPQLHVADFSARAIEPAGGEVDVVGPGVDVYSSWISPQHYETISGTSMATPHVAGLAALLAEASGARGQQLWDRIIQAARSLDLPREDVGAGLVIAPNEQGGKPAQEWVITVADERASDLTGVAAELRAAGFVVTRQLATIGMLYVAAPEGIEREALLQLPGVASADRNHQHQTR